MKKRLLLLPVLLAVPFLIWACTSCSRLKPEPIVLVHIHFAGAQTISAGTNSPVFQEFCSPEAHALESQTLDKLSHAPGVWFKDALPSGAPDGSALLRPLLDDFLKSEWTFEISQNPGSPEYALAIRLDDARSQLWQSNLCTLLQSWTKISAQNISGGWELKADTSPNLFRVVRSGNWLIVGCGQNELTLSDEWVQTGNIADDETNWLNATVDWPGLAQIFPAVAQCDFPKIRMRVTGNEQHLQLFGIFDLSQPLPALEKWQFPTNLIHQPLTSFTALRGFAPWLASQGWATPLQLSPPPDQLFIWSLETMPLQTCLTVPVQNATNALAQLGQNFAVNTNWQIQTTTPYPMNQDNHRIWWQGVPFIGPEIRAMNEPSGDFLFADVFPNTLRGQAPPPGLLQALDRGNLVFYHWEMTSERLKELPQLTQLAMFLTRHYQLDVNSVAGKWLNRLGPLQGNSMTEVIQTGPQQLAFMRIASSGFTGIELTALANWLEAPNFPGCDLRMPPPPPRRMIPALKRKQLSFPGMPGPPQ